MPYKDRRIAGLRQSIKYLNREPAKVFILPVEVAGYSHGLAEGLWGLGKDVTYVEIAGYPFIPDRSSELPYKLLTVHRKTTGFFGYVRWLFARLLLSLKIATDADLIIAQFAMSLLPLNLDLLLYKIRGVKVVMLAGYGSETRPVQMNHPQTHFKNSLGGHLRLAVLSVWQRLRIYAVYKTTDFFFTSPQISHFAPGPFFNFLDLGHPLSAETILLASELSAARAKGNLRQSLKISHVPSSAFTKGTDEIRSVMARLSASYPEVVYSELSNVTHTELLRHVSKQDLIIDQLYSDYPFPVTSAEAYLLGVPSIVGGYFKGWSEDFYQSFDPPSVQVSPEMLFEALEKIVTEGRSELGKKAKIGQQEVLANFGSQHVASRLLDAIMGRPNSGVALRQKPKVPYRDGLGGERVIIEQFTRSNVAKFFLPELS